MHCIYIIYSPSFNKYYIGESIDIIKRLEEHNSKIFSKSSTTFTSDWELAIYFKVADRSEARIVERYIKSMKSKKFIQKLILDELFRKTFFKTIHQKFKIIIFHD